MVHGTTHLRTLSPCARCVHRPECEGFLHHVAEAVVWYEVHHAGYVLPTVIVDCEGRFTPRSRYRPLRLH